MTCHSSRCIHVHLDFSRDFSENHFQVREGLTDVLRVIKTLKEYQREHSAPLKVILESFWLRRDKVKTMLLRFLESENLPYTQMDSGGISAFEYLEYFCMLPLEKFRAIHKTGIETGSIFIPG